MSLLELNDALIPAFDDSVGAKHKLERLAALDGRIEDLAVK